MFLHYDHTAQGILDGPVQEKWRGFHISSTNKKRITTESICIQDLLDPTYVEQ